MGLTVSAMAGVKAKVEWSKAVTSSEKRDIM